MLDNDDLIVGTKTVIRPLWRWVSGIAIVSLISGSTLVAGFIWFANQKVVASPAVTAIAPADGIVVVTGGQERVERSFELLLRARGERLLISGVGLCITKEGVRHYMGSDGSDTAINRFDCCVDLDRMATNTLDNATATKQWAKKHGYDEVILVTSAFHMARTKLIFKAAMPNIQFTPYPVVPKAFRGVEWWQDQGIMKVLMREFGKYLLTWAGIKARIILGITSGD